MLLMKTLKNGWLLLCILAITLTGLTSCTMDDSREAEWNLAGDWIIFDIQPAGPYADPPYRIGDMFSFYTNNYNNNWFETRGYDGYYEKGKWYIESDGLDNYTLYMSFDGYNATIIADMSSFPGSSYIGLRVSDAERGEYYLRLRRR